MIGLIWAETRKLLRTASIWVVTALCLLFTVWAYSVTRSNIAGGFWSPELIDPEISLTYASANFATIGSLFTVFVGAVSVGLEFGFRTWPALLTHGVKRRQVWLAKLCSVIGLVAAWVFASLTLGYLCSLWASGRFALPLINRSVLTQIAVLLFTLWFWALFAFTFSLAFRGSGAGIAVGILFPYANMMLEGVGGVKMWLPVWNQRALYAAVWGTEMQGVAGFYPDPTYPSTWQAVTLLTVMLVALVAASYYQVRQLRPE